MVIRLSFLIAFCTVWLYNQVCVSAAASENSCEREMASAAARYQVPLAVLYAVGLTETGKRRSLQPYALNIDGNAEFYPTAAAALARYRAAVAAGARLIDLGCMQINAHYHAEAFKSVADMLVPAENVAYAAQFLRKLRDQEGSWTMAVARYNAGPNNDPAQKIYVCRVMSNMVASGFGRWTPQAQDFCR